MTIETHLESKTVIHVQLETCFSMITKFIKFKIHSVIIIIMKNLSISILMLCLSWNRSSRWSCLFFVLYILLGVYFLTNLILAVVYDSFKNQVTLILLNDSVYQFNLLIHECDGDFICSLQNKFFRWIKWEKTCWKRHSIL